MARRKGKSRRRIKDWKQRYAAGEDPEDAAARRQKFTRPAVKLPPWRLEAENENLEDLPKDEGMVTGLFPGGATVRSDDEELLCGVAGTFRPPEGASALAVGDEVTVAVTRAEHQDETADDRDRADGMILSRQPRRTALSRPQPRSGKRTDPYSTETFEKVIAANMDVLLVIASTCQPPLRHGLIDRFLIVAERGELQPILAINKIDLAEPDEKVLADLQAMAPDVFLCSAKSAEGLAPLRDALRGKRSVLAGASGVGKSTLINALVPEADATTRTVRAKGQRGRHTTSAAKVYDLPDGGMLVDTPGVRELGVRLLATELPWYFPEFEQYAPQCRFNDCTHTHEPDCAVISAVEAGQIPPRRYRSYLTILESMEDAS